MSGEEAITSAPAEAHVETCPLDELHVLVLVSGEHDLATAAVLRAVLERLADERWPFVVVDFTTVSFIDSTTLGALGALRRRMRAFGGEMVVVAESARIRRMFEMTLLDRLFTLHASRADALRSLGAPG
jgi:anti-sigma B factor antagonist